MAKNPNLGRFKGGDMKDLLKRLGRLDIEVTMTNGDHYRVHCPAGDCVIPRTPSDWRSLKNVVGELRKLGADL